MKNRSTAASMKKLLIATSIVAMSSTAMAAESDTRQTESEKTDKIAVTANFIKLLTLNLDVNTINFGDVFKDSTVAVVPVNANITGDSGETFTFGIATDGSAVLGGTLSGTGTALTDDAVVVLPFTVGLNTADIAADIDETVTFTITYDSIAGTTSSDT
jgi:hypothetical protein